ncbi:hypothetical protein CHN50_09855 [Priestia aryabhattai]|uniref:hypothetical protein n=1 Tax=Bacillaceae TaxID=186817 RepID=UPI000BA0556E|nr:MULTISPECIES: hypothetical protein [Bacillaceae]OZT12729.1 hypothetical protein CHN50_09855 [Priestia aryabhattai]TDB53813.1 hypothetical protein EPL02_05350 [Bacillus sp. CBEL-1]USY55517.1 hypothetical protein NIZ91_02205 [Bacillus sp. 1780r2a1]
MRWFTFLGLFILSWFLYFVQDLVLEDYLKGSISLTLIVAIIIKVIIFFLLFNLASKLFDKYQKKTSTKVLLIVTAFFIVFVIIAIADNLWYEYYGDWLIK